MKLLEVPAALRCAKKEDIFIGDLNELRGQQFIKDNATIFYRDVDYGKIEGPNYLYSFNHFPTVYRDMIFGHIAVLEEVIENADQYVFDLVLRQAKVIDFLETPRHLKINKLYYKYQDKKIYGPYYIDSYTTKEVLTAELNDNLLFVINERQHFRFRRKKNVA